MSAASRPYWDSPLELLLLLTALFASLTGAASGDRSAVRQVQGVAVVRAAGVAQVAVQPSRAALPQTVAPARVRPAKAVWFSIAAAPLRPLRLVFERRLE